MYKNGAHFQPKLKLIFEAGEHRDIENARQTKSGNAKRKTKQSEGREGVVIQSKNARTNLKSEKTMVTVFANALSLLS